MNKMSNLKVMILCGSSPRHLYVANKLCAASNPLAIVQEVGSQWTAKKVLKLKRKDIEKWTGDGSGGVENEYFRYFIDVEQNPDDCEEALTTRKLI